MELLVSAVNVVQADPLDFAQVCITHLALSLSALLLAGLLGVPVGFWCARQKGLPQNLEAIVQGVRVVPALALLGLLLPLLGTGFLPALVALVALGCPSVLVSTAAGFRQVPPDILDAARGMGMDDREVFARVEWPLSLPAILSGFRIAAVDVISGATLAAFIGGGGLGVFIVNGLAMADYGLMLAGAVPVALMAMLADGVFALLERFSGLPSIEAEGRAA